jgi:nucleoid DNA-binding protein
MAATAVAPVRPLSKSALTQTLADKTGLSKKQVASVIDGIDEIIRDQLGRKGPGVFALPGLIKIQTVTKKAVKAGTRPHPFKPGETMEVKARPARKVVKVRAFKALRDMVS